MKRFFCPNLDSGILDDAESHHCLHVMRMKEGDLLTVFNGRGEEWKARLAGVQGKTVAFSQLSATTTERPTARVRLAQAMTKNKAMDLIIQKATELGVSSIAPLQSDRSVSHVEQAAAEARREKWRQITIEAAKQSGQNWLPEIEPLRKPGELSEELLRDPGMKLIASLQAEARPLKQTLRELLDAAGDSEAARHATIMIGPEGDFTPAEIGQARAAGFLPVSLGNVVLRSETAAIYTLSALLYDLAD